MNLSPEEVVPMADERSQADLSFAFSDDALEMADLGPILREVQPGITTGAYTRTPQVPGGEAIWFDAALVLSVTIAARGFLGELGKDLYRGFRTALFAAYNKARTWTSGQLFVPLVVMIPYDSDSIVLFSFAADMDAATFDQAVQSLPSAYQAVQMNPGVYAAIMEFDGERGVWKQTHSR